MNQRYLYISTITKVLFQAFKINPHYPIRYFITSYKHSNLQIRRLKQQRICNFYTTETKNIDSNKIHENNNISHNPSTQEELLEKFIAGISSDIYSKNRVYKHDVLRVLNKIREISFSTRKQGMLLLHCCTELLPDETPAMRIKLAEEIWKVLKPHTLFVTNHYNELLRVYKANYRTLNVNNFIQQMEPMKPNIVTYELFMEVLAEAGDLNQATEVLANMKAQSIPASEAIFNSFILCQGKCGNLENINEILKTMRSLKLEKSVDTYTAVARSLAFNKKPQNLLEEMDKARKAKMKFEESHIMDIVKTCASVELYSVIPRVLRFLPENTLKKPSISPFMQSVATLLVFQNHPLAALEIYNSLPLPSFGPSDDIGLHGRSLVRDCVRANLPSGVIGLVTEHLMSTGRNPIAFQNACEMALQLGKFHFALDMFVRMKQMGLPLRPHYFWPILIQSSKSYGERGIMNTLSTMVTMEVSPDYDTIVNYALPYVSFTSPQNLMKKFQECGLVVSTVLTPMVQILLNTGQVRAAVELCKNFTGKLDGEKLIKPLVKGYLTTSDIKFTMKMLEEICEKTAEKGKDCAGRFLCVITKSDKFTGDITDFRKIIQSIKESNLRISTMSMETCVFRLPDNLNPSIKEEIQKELMSITDEKLIDESDVINYQITHPSKMNEECLHSHLTELEAKGMNTRGVLRKLLQKHCQQGNLVAAKEILNKCQKEQVHLSAGMKASIFDLYVKLGELEMAEECLADLTKSSPKFALDEFKIIDFATLMVYNDQFERAVQVILEHSKNRNIIGGRGIETNCWKLLDALATNSSPEFVQKMYQTLISYGYCKPTNIILGPLIRVHLKSNDIETAVKEFVRLANEHNKTPLKHELLCKILENMSDNLTDDSFVFDGLSDSKLDALGMKIIDINRKVHGDSDVQVTMISVLAELGYKKTLRKLLLDSLKISNPDAILRRCERFATENKMAALEAIVECAYDLRNIDIASIYDLILDCLQRADDTQGALSLWYRMQETDILPTSKFIKNLTSMLKVNNKPIPSELMTLNNRQNRATK